MRFGASTLAAVLLVTTGLAGACTEQAASPPSAAVTAPAGSASGSPSASTEATPAASAWPHLLPVPIAKAGLHQTGKRPTADNPVFHAEMTDLWAAVVTGRPKYGLRAFFPLVAYEQVKAIADPEADWHNRLEAEFNLDVAAAHELLGRHARYAALL